MPARPYLVNGTPGDRLVLDLEKRLEKRDPEVTDTRGRSVRADADPLSAGLRSIDVRPAGWRALGHDEEGES